MSKKNILVEFKVFNKIRIGLYLWLGGLSITSTLAIDDFYLSNMDKVYASFNRTQRIQFHKNFLNILERETLKTEYEQKKIKVYTSYQSLDFLNLWVDSAQASLDDPTIFCNFGGWVTNIEASKCLAPWSRSVKNDPELDIFGDHYAHSCGGANLFRCNPLVFGPGDDGKGFCVSTDDSDPNLSTTACMEEFLKDPKAVDSLIDDLEANPKKLAAYLATAVETIRSCNVQTDPFSYCGELTNLMENVSLIASRCTDQAELVSLLPDIITPLNEDDLNKITEGLGTVAREYAEQLEELKLEARKHNKRVLEQAIASAQKDQRLIDTLDRVRNNASKCLRDLCNNSRFRGKSRKTATSSIAKCAAYVKHAFFPYSSDSGARFASYPEYPWDNKADDAVESSSWLKKHGFVNVLDYPELGHLTPENAPVGAIIVYEKQNSSRKTRVDGVLRGAPGHIEYKASENEYISDFINDEPTRVGGERTPIGIYFRITKEFTDQLKEVPEV